MIIGKNGKNKKFKLFIILSVLSFLPMACTKEVSEPFESEGLSTIPHYEKGGQRFNTGAAKKKMARLKKQKEEAAKKKSEEKLEDIVKDTIGIEIEFDVLDPWVSPPTRSREDLPLALQNFPTDFFGYPDWNKGLEQGIIKPKGNLDGSDEEKLQLEYTDILIEINDPRMGDVLFPHMKHVMWLSCNNCHPAPFKKKRGATRFSMNDVWAGQYCGKCHGKVAFMPKGYENCKRCHSQKNKR